MLSDGDTAELLVAGLSGDDTRGTDDDDESDCWRGMDRYFGLRDELLGVEDMDWGCEHNIPCQESFFVASRTTVARVLWEFEVD